MGKFSYIYYILQKINKGAKNMKKISVVNGEYRMKNQNGNLVPIENILLGVEEKKFGLRDRILNWTMKHRKVISLISWIVVLAVVSITIIFVIKSCNSTNGVATLDQAATTIVATTMQSTTVQPTTIEPTTVQPTTVQSTTSKPEEKNVEVEKDNYDDGSDDNSYENYYTPQRQNDTSYNTGDNSDMKTEDHPNDSSYQDEDQNGASITYGGNEGYGASISSDKESPVPEKVFEEEHPLPPTVSQEEIEQAPIVNLTPAS